MLIKYHALTSVLKKKLNAIYILVGNDYYLLNDAALQIKKSFSHVGEFATTIIDINTPNDWSYLMTEANSYSLFNEHVLLDARFDKKTIDAAGKALLVEYLLDVNDRCLIILRAPQLALKSLQWFSDSPNAILVHIQSLAAPALQQWISTQFKTHELKALPEVPSLIHQFTQGNMLAAAQLIDKLTLIYSANDLITPEIIREHLSCQSHFELYELTEACLEGSVVKALHLLQQFHLERVEPTLILWVLTQEIRLLIQLETLKKQSGSIESACQQLKIWSSRVRLYVKASSRLSLQQLYTLLQQCAALDEIIKTTQSSQTWNNFNRIALSICN